jgi:putative membrane protein
MTTRSTILGSAAALVILGAGTFALADTKGDQTFITKAIQANLAEISVGQLAGTKGTTDAVRSYGQLLVTDHTKANEKATTLATAAGVTPPTAADAGGKKLYDKLSGLSGAAFDRAFVGAMVKDHKQAIKLFNKEANSGTSPIALFAKDTVPTLQGHLKTAQSLWQGFSGT